VLGFGLWCGRHRVRLLPCKKVDTFRVALGFSKVPL
jgi:hypothetical protein